MMKYRFLMLILFPVHLFAQSFTYTSKPALIGLGNSSSIAFDADKDEKSDILIMGKTGTSYYTRLYHNNGDSTFLDLGVPFPGLAYGSADVLDYNNDGLIDIVLCGFDGVNKRFCLFKNLGSNLFSEVSTSIPGVDYANVKCADLNLDGLMDIIVMGQTATQKILKIYSNSGNGSFTEVNSLEGMYDGGLIVTDINNDSFSDLIVCGVSNSYEMISRIYLNSGKDNFLFKERTSNITAIHGGKIDNIDFNADGYSDVLVTGKAANGDYISQVFRNNSGSSFSLFTSIKGLNYSTSVTGDFNNDGFSDILIAGLDASSVYKTIYYVNNLGAGFTEQPTSITNLNKGSLSLIDLTNDGKLDILISGFSMSGPVSYIYNNNVVPVNSEPTAPLSLLSYSLNDSVLLKWRRPLDLESRSKSLTYNLYIKKVADGDTIFSAPSSYLTGNRYVYKQGLQDTFVVVKHLPYGRYYWSVQSIDQGYKGSAFAAPKEFNICNNLDIGQDKSICKGNSIMLTAGSPSDVVNWYISDSPLVSFHNGSAVTIDVNKNLKIWAVVSTSIGCTLADTIKISMLSLPETSLKHDTTVCIYSKMALSLKSSNYLGDWTSKFGSITDIGKSNINFKVMRNDAVYVKITDNHGCVNYDTTNIAIHLLPESHLPTDTAACFKSELFLNAGGLFDKVVWLNSNGDQISNKNRINYTVVKSEKLSVKMVSQYSCVNYDTVSVVMNNLPATNAGRDTVICPGSSVKLGVIPKPGRFLYDWSPALTLDDMHIVQPKATPKETTKYNLKITDSNTCSNYDSVIITLNTASRINTGGDKSICLGGSVSLGGVPLATGSILPYSYQWFPVNGLDNSSVANPIANPAISTVYNLILSAGKCIVDTVSVTVNVLPLPIVTKSKDFVIGYQESAPIWASGGSQFKWEPIASLDNSSISNPMASPETTTAYTVFVSDANGCESSAQVTVTVQNELFVPNLFTPNGDGKNDFFMVYGTGIDKIHLRIYNTEGIMVYETSDIDDATKTGWDGMYNGNPLSAGKYLWVLEVISTDGKPLMYNNSNKGIITLLR